MAQVVETVEVLTELSGILARAAGKPSWGCSADDNADGDEHDEEQDHDNDQDHDDDYVDENMTVSMTVTMRKLS